LALASLLTCNTALAGGFQILEHGAVSTGMANARTALADDVSALYFNPAAISELPGLQLELGVTGILPQISYSPAGNPDPARTYPSYADGQYVFREINDGTHPVDAKLRGFNPIHIYAAYRFDSLGLSVGYGLNNPFGLGTFWPGDWDGRFIATETEIQTFFNQPTVAVDVAQLLGIRDRFHLSVAVGYNFVYATARLAKKIDLRAAEAPSLGTILAGEGEMRMTGSAWGHGFNAAVYFELPGWFSLGASIRTGIDLPFSGTARFALDEAGVRAADFLHLRIPETTGGELTLGLPANVNFGLALLAIDRLTIAFDVYAAMFQSYDQLELVFACIAEGTCSDTLDAGPIAKNWGTAWQFAFGLEYRLLDLLAIRAGTGIVLSPVPAGTYDPALPDGRRTLIAFGLGWRGSFLKVDLGYMLALWDGTKANEVGAGDNNNPEGKANGTYTTTTHILALSIAAWF
jgi:long-chain fatty acid transport protein